MGVKQRLLMGFGALILTATPALAQDDVPPTPFIVIDQFGYLPDAAKIAVVRDPEVGFDSGWDFTPGPVYQVIDTRTQKVVFEGKPTVWNGGVVDPSSGDHIWHFDFSSVTAPGSYLIRDKQAAYDSYGFEISANVYKPVLKAATRMLFYQRAGFAKEARYAGEGWADGASHMGKGQDSEARLYSRKGDKSTERDLHGGWYDAGDFNKYTAWTASYVISLLGTYAEKPDIWTDDFNLPESGNGVPDLLDEVRWGMDWLVRMQNEDGSVLSVMGLASGSPPSAAKGPSYYGPASTAATYGAAGAYAYAAKIYGGFPQFADYAADLKSRAIRAFAWAQTHPNVTFYNNDLRDHSEGLAAGQQEPDDYGRAMKALTAAIYLYDLTGEASYRTYVDDHYRDNNIYRNGFTQDADYEQTAPLLHYAVLPGATPAVAADIRKTFTEGYEQTGWKAATLDPYMAQVSGYWWGSNSIKSNAGNVYADEARYGLGEHSAQADMAAAAGYIHYLHGVNPLGKVYLSNMGGLGAENSVDEFYHTWFAHGSAKWDSVKRSKYGPPPGFVVGGANPTYNWAEGCPGLNPGCGQAPLSPPVGQPEQKAYADFNEAWPIDSWEVTENSEGYQVPYIRLLARFVSK
jgi:endoglucanase